MVLFDEQFCNTVFCSKPIHVNAAASILRGSCCRYVCDGDRHEQSLQVSRSLLLCTNHNRGSDPYVYASADSAQAGCRYQAFLPCVNKKVRGQSTLPHTGTTGCVSEGNPSVQWEGVPPPVQQLLTRPHCDTLVPTDHFTPLRHNLGHETHKMCTSSM